jgi:hypothetical protein
LHSGNIPRSRSVPLDGLNVSRNAMAVYTNKKLVPAIRGRKGLASSQIGFLL